MPPKNHHHHHQKLQQQTGQELTQEQQHGLQQQKTTLQFDTVEEMLRYDARQTQVPPALAARVAEAVAREPVPCPSWWRRVLGGPR